MNPSRPDPKHPGLSLRRWAWQSPLLATMILSLGFLHPISCSDPGAPLTPSGLPDAGTVTGQDGGTAVQNPPTHSVDLAITPTGLELLGVEPYDEMMPGAPALERNQPDALWWFIKDTSGQTVAGGMVADPRVAHADPAPTGELAGTDRSPFALLRIDVPLGQGKLQLFEQPPGSSSFRDNGCNGPHLLGDVDLLGGSGETTTPLAIPGLRKIVDHGTCKGNVNLLIMSEGYTAEELVGFRSDASRVANGLQKYKVFADHWDQVNVWTLEVASMESGIDDPDKGITRDTAFGVTYGTGGLHHCTLAKDPKAQVKKLWQRTKTATRANAVMILTNDRELGGCASGDTATVTNGPWQVHVFAHELGHALFGLADEYIVTDGKGDADNSRCTLGNVRELNTTRHPTSPPWAALLTTKQLPTTGNDASTVGAFEGAQYCSAGVYRPQVNCMMRDNWSGADWCRVCLDHGSKWIEARKASSAADATCAKPDEAPGNCFGDAVSCPSGTVCSWNGATLGYCCRKPFEGTKTCYTDDECSGGICAFGGPPKNFFYCSQPDSTASCVK